MERGFTIPLGVQVKDTVTGFTGVVTGRADYLTGCRQYCVTTKSKDGKPADYAWFDEQRLSVTSKRAVALATGSPNGGPQNTPPKH